jgi:predicted transcriptional regulator
MKKQFYYPGIVKVLCAMKSKNINIMKFCKNIDMTWSQANNAINNLYIYDLVDIKKSKNMLQFNLTPDGERVKELFLKINEIINHKRNDMIARMYGSESKEELIKSIENDLL